VLVDLTVEELFEIDMALYALYEVRDLKTGAFDKVKMAYEEAKEMSELDMSDCAGGACRL